MMRLRPGFYGIADASFGDPVALGRLLLRGGACAVQLRCKAWTDEAVAEALLALRPHCQQAGVPLIVNDRAALLGLADGLHLGQHDGPFPAGPGLRGRSTHSLADVEAALAEGAHYLGFGPVFPTQTKPDAEPVQGLEALALASARAPVPVVAIGGITLERLPAVKAAGAWAWALISAVLAASDPLAAARAASGLTDCHTSGAPVPPL